MRFLLFSPLLFYVVGLVSTVFYLFFKRRFSGVLSSTLISTGFFLHTLVLFWRIYLSGRMPIATVHETLFFYSWSTVAITLVVVFRYGERLTGLITLPLSIFALYFSVLNIKGPSAYLPLILKTYWFETHVITSFAAYSLFTLSFSGGILYIIGEAGKVERWAPVLQDFQDISGRALLWGFFFFSVSMFSGAIWGYLAWGAYWLWEPKILWSFIVWFWYAGAMHVWYVREWRGKGLSIAVIIGFFIVLFTYLGVGLLMKSSHSF